MLTLAMTLALTLPVPGYNPVDWFKQSSKFESPPVPTAVAERKRYASTVAHVYVRKLAKGIEYFAWDRTVNGTVDADNVLHFECAANEFVQTCEIDCYWYGDNPPTTTGIPAWDFTFVSNVLVTVNP